MTDIDLSQVPLADLAAEITRRADSDYRLLPEDDEFLSEADDKTLLEAVTDRGYTILDEDEGDYVRLDEARSLLNRGDIRECLYAIERELPHEFAGLTEMVFKIAAAAETPDLATLPKRVQAVISTVRQGQTLCLHKHLNREGKTEKLWFFEPSGRQATPKAAEAATATAFLKPAMDGLLPNMSQTWRAAQ